MVIIEVTAKIKVKLKSHYVSNVSGDIWREHYIKYIILFQQDNWKFRKKRIFYKTDDIYSEYPYLDKDYITKIAMEEILKYYSKSVRQIKQKIKDINKQEITIKVKVK